MAALNDYKIANGGALPTSLRPLVEHPAVALRPFNGYADQVASLYSGMDLRKYF